MSDKMRWRYSDTNPVVAAVDAATEIEIGDLLWQDVDDAKPARALQNARGCGPTQKVFADTFLGVAMCRSKVGDTDPIRVATTGVFEFDCPSDTFELGDLVAPNMRPNGSGALTNQQVVSVRGVEPEAIAIGRVAKRAATLTTSVLIDIRSTVMTGGVLGSTRNGV